MAEPAAAPRPGAVDRISAALALAGGALVLALAGLTTASVVLRRLTSNGIGGDVEIVQMGLAVAVFAFLPICLLRGANIVVDTFTARAPAAVRAALDALWALAYAAVAGLLAWRTAAGAADTLRSGTTTMVLGLPMGWAMAACAAAAAWLAVVALVAAGRAARRGAA